MVKQHLSRLAMPKTWPIKRKGIKFIIKPKSSRKMKYCIPLVIVIKDLLKYAKTRKEVKKIINEGNVLINKSKPRDIKTGLGLMDVLEFPKLKEQYRILLNKQGKFRVMKISAKEAGVKPCKITGKRNLKGKKLQINLDDGSNLLDTKGNYKVGDSLLVDTEKRKAKEHIPLEKGAVVYLTGGNNVNAVGTVEGFKEFSGTRQANIILKVSGKTLETKKDYALAIGKGKPAIAVEEKK